MSHHRCLTTEKGWMPCPENLCEADQLAEMLAATEAERDKSAKNAGIYLDRQREAEESLRALSTSMAYGELTARAEAAEKERDEARALYESQREYADVQYRNWIAAEAREKALREALARILGHELVQSHPYGQFCIDTARAALAASSPEGGS